MVIYLNAKVCRIAKQVGQLLSSSPPNLKSLSQDFKELHLVIAPTQISSQQVVNREASKTFRDDNGTS